MVHRDESIHNHITAYIYDSLYMPRVQLTEKSFNMAKYLYVEAYV
jgi:hypothetical protein